MLISLLTRTGTVAMATKYAGYFCCYSYDETLDITLFFTLMLFMLQRKANTGAEVILKVKVNQTLHAIFFKMIPIQ